MQPQDFIMMPIPASRYVAVCALLGGAVLIANQAFGQPAGGEQAPKSPSPDVGGDVSQDTGQSSANTDGLAESGASAGTGESATTGASPSDGEIDAGGHPWSADLHASTKGKTKDGLWRMKVGVSRPDPLPGFPADNGATGAGTGTSSETGAASATSQTATDSASVQSDTSGDDDEFAAFRAAAATSDANDAAAAASVPARKFSDADLGALCNQAAVKLGDPSPVKEIIAQYVPAGEVAHSRNIPADKREEFAKEVEAKAGIQFAG